MFPDEKEERVPLFCILDTSSNACMDAKLERISSAVKLLKYSLNCVLLKKMSLLVLDL